jgi:L-alanine-DL-glutamate epimerase-like enolase superfamily enzyme
MIVKFYPFSLKLAKVFKISYESRTEQPTLIVELSHAGEIGYGEATAISYYNITVEQMIEQLKEITPLLESYNFATPEKLWDVISPILLDKHSFLLSAIDSASHDLYGKLNKYKVFESISNGSLSTPLSNYTISIGNADEMVKQIVDKPWPVYKLKLGADTDPNVLLEIRKVTDANLRIDANAAWDLEIATKWLPFLREAGVELIEQPFAIDNFADLDKFREFCEIPIVADESCQKEEDVDICAKHFDAINIKLMKCGGLTPAIRMVKRAKELNLKLMAGCMTESSVGISAMTQIATSLDYIDADGAILLSNDPAEGVQIIDGRIIYPDAFGLGINLKKEVLDVV